MRTLTEERKKKELLAKAVDKELQPFRLQIKIEEAKRQLKHITEFKQKIEDNILRMEEELESYKVNL